MTGAGRDSTLQAKAESAASVIERPLRRLLGSSRANIVAHAGTISVFLLGVVVFTGIYITLFYEYGFTASYEAVAGLQAHPVQRVMRALHRYASAALVVTTVVHAWRIFVAGRFTASRRFRWLSGMSALVTVWLAGVSGYWLVWDVRAQAIGEGLGSLLGGTGFGAGIVSTFTGSSAGTGSGLMLVVWFVHLGLTAVIGFAMWRHLRRSRLHWVPPRHWMIAMAVGLVAVSILLPVGMLDRADPGRLVPDLALDPFMLFLLPPLLSDYAWLVALAAIGVIGLISAVPWLLRDRRAAVVSIDTAACTGCELCVVDCPYLALSMDATGSVAVVDPAVCVGCGICVGSCSFGAIDLPGLSTPATLDPADRHVIVACRRHVVQGIDHGEDSVVLEVTCTGAFHSQAVGDLIRRGATGVQLIGCAPNECVYGIGNELAHERLEGTRAPHVARRYAGVTTEDFVALGDESAAVDHPGEHPTADPNSIPATARSRAVAGVAVLGSVALIALATLAPFAGRDGTASVRVIVNHTPGARLIGQSEASPTTRPTGATTAESDSESDSQSDSEDASVTVSIGGRTIVAESVSTWSGKLVGIVDADVEPGSADLQVELTSGRTGTVLFDGPIEFTAGRRFVVEARDAPAPAGVREGREVFEDSHLGACGICHSVEPTDDGGLGDGVGPNLAEVGSRAAGRIPGQSAEQYLTDSILDPNAYIVDGYRSDQMLRIYQDRLTVAQIESLVEYLLSLQGDGN